MKTESQSIINVTKERDGRIKLETDYWTRMLTKREARRLSRMLRLVAW